MDKLYILLFLLLGMISKSISQKTLNDYYYIIVSEQFEFQKEKDKHQLNSLTKFLFNKNGFHAYFDREVPNYVRRCDGLWAEAEGGAGMVYTIINIVIKDCNGFEVFRSQKGKSKIKDFKKAYYEAMREAFESIEVLNISQKPVEESKIDLKESAPVKTNKVVLEKNNEPKNNYIFKNLPTSKYTTYKYLENTFLLRKTSKGYNLYQEVVGADDDLLLIGRIVFLEKSLEFKSDTESEFVYFDSSENMIIGKGDNQKFYTSEN